jgi:gentisate 1,2-dioxygenase
MMVATRAPGYHSNPHRHDAEQINYVLDGEVWVFMESESFLMKKGDFSRIPRNALHWAWNRSDKPCTLVEAHAPACDPLVRENALGLFVRGRDAEPIDRGEHRAHARDRPRCNRSARARLVSDRAAG